MLFLVTMQHTVILISNYLVSTNFNHCPFPLYINQLKSLIYLQHSLYINKIILEKNIDIHNGISVCSRKPEQ